MNTRPDLEKIIDQFSKTPIMVIGDLMLDRYLFGHVDRLSPEAPIPVVLERETTVVPGGAANTAANIVSLGGTGIVIGVVGNDQSGQDLKDALTRIGVATSEIITAHRPTTEKMRVIGNHQQIVRIDREQATELDLIAEDHLLDSAKKYIARVRAIVICDYAKGVISERLLTAVRKLAATHQLPVLVDVRPEHRAWYHDLTLITPNKNELASMTGQKIRTKEDALAAGLRLSQELSTNLLVTLSEEGVLVIDKDSISGVHFPTRAQEVTDVSGAGDTVIAASALALAGGAELAITAEIANYAASVVVAKLGTAVGTIAELRAALRR